MMEMHPVWVVFATKKKTGARGVAAFCVSERQGREVMDVLIASPEYRDVFMDEGGAVTTSAPVKQKPPEVHGAIE